MRIMGFRSLRLKRHAGPSRGKCGVSTLRIRNQTKMVVIADFAQVANTSATRRKGLLGRQSFNQGEGLWISPCESIHTFWMKFPIDVIYLNRKKEVCKIRTAVVPWRLSICLLAHSVLELPVGTINRTRTEPGDQLEMVEITQQSLHRCETA
jgi:uncharacterized membrane protein (UPF0127 family)